MKIVKKFAVGSILFVGMVPMVFASWWNPFTWFNKKSIQAEQGSLIQVKQPVSSEKNSNTVTQDFKKEQNDSSLKDLEIKIKAANLEDKFIIEDGKLYFVGKKVKGFIYSNGCYSPSGETSEGCVKVEKEKYEGYSIEENNITLKATYSLIEKTKQLLNVDDLGSLTFRVGKKVLRNTTDEPVVISYEVAQEKRNNGKNKVYSVVEQRWGCGGDTQGCEGSTALMIQE